MEALERSGRGVAACPNGSAKGVQTVAWLHGYMPPGCCPATRQSVLDAPGRYVSYVIRCTLDIWQTAPVPA